MVVVVMTIFSFISFGYFFHLKWLIVACTVAEVAIKAKATVNCRFFRIPLDERKRLAWLSALRNELLGCNHQEMLVRLCVKENKIT